MKLSVEAKVAASVAAAFVALTVGVIAQGDGGDQSAGAAGYGPTNRYDSSLTGRSNAEEERHRTQWQLRE
jgi:hypothetical protein